MPLRHEDTKSSQRIQCQCYILSKAFEPLCLCGRRKLLGADSILMVFEEMFNFMLLPI